MIPKIIHQTWKDKNIPLEWQQGPIEWKKHHPDYEYRFWTDQDIRNHMLNYHPEFLSLFDSYPYNIQRADMIRYFILYDFGGIYCDLDNYPLENLDKYLIQGTDTYISESTLVSGVTSNNIIISKRGAKIWLKVHENLRKQIPWYAFGKHLTVFYSTGPFLIDKTFKDNNENFTLLKKEKFNPYSVYDDYDIIKPNIVIRSVRGGSWFGYDTIIVIFITKIIYKIMKLFK